MSNNKSSQAKQATSSKPFHIPFGAAILVANEYARATKDMAFINPNAPKRRIIDGTAYECYSHGHGPSQVLCLKVTPDYNRTASALVEIDRIAAGRSHLMNQVFSLQRDLDHKQSQRFPEEQVERARIAALNAQDEFRQTEERFEECARIVEAVRPTVYLLPLESLENFVLYETALGIASKEQEPVQIARPKFPADVNEWMRSRKKGGSEPTLEQKVAALDEIEDKEAAIA